MMLSCYRDSLGSDPMVTPLHGEIIECYSEDKYGPSCLVFGEAKGKVLHIQCSLDPVWIITAYDPRLFPEKWDHSFKKRKTG